MGDTRDICPHLDSVGEVTRDDLLLKSKVRDCGSQSSPFQLLCMDLHVCFWRKCCLISPSPTDLPIDSMSHRVTLCDPTNFSLSFYPDWICHLAEVVQLCIWLEVWCLGMKCYELMVGLFYREVSHSSRTWLQTNLLFIMNVQGTCQSCGAVGPNLWACLQVKMACLCAWCGGTLLQ